METGSPPTSFPSPSPTSAPPWPRPWAQGRGQQASPPIGSTQLSLTPRLPPSALTSEAGEEPSPLLPAQEDAGAEIAGSPRGRSRFSGLLPCPAPPPTATLAGLGRAGQGGAERGVRMHEGGLTLGAGTSGQAWALIPMREMCCAERAAAHAGLVSMRNPAGGCDRAQARATPRARPGEVAL